MDSKPKAKNASCNSDLPSVFLKPYHIYSFYSCPQPNSKLNFELILPTHLSKQHFGKFTIEDCYINNEDEIQSDDKKYIFTMPQMIYLADTSFEKYQGYSKVFGFIPHLDNIFKLEWIPCAKVDGCCEDFFFGIVNFSHKRSYVSDFENLHVESKIDAGKGTIYGKGRLACISSCFDKLKKTMRIGAVAENLFNFQFKDLIVDVNTQELEELIEVWA